MALEKELATYQRHRESLLDRQGKFVLVHQDDVVGVWDTYADALRAGYEKFGLDTFLVKKIEVVEEVQLISRDVEFPCRT